MKLFKTPGATSEIWQLFFKDSSSVVGAGLAGLAFNTGSFTCYYHRDTDTAAVALTLETMTVGTYASSDATHAGFKKIDDTNMPGWCQFCPPNAALAAGAKSCGFLFKGAANLVPLAIEVQLDGYSASAPLAALQADMDDVLLFGDRIPAALTAAGNMKADMLAINNSTVGAIRLALSTGQYIAGVVDTTGLSPTVSLWEATGTSPLNEATANHFRGRSVLWLTGAKANGQMEFVTASSLNSTRQRFAVKAITDDGIVTVPVEAPANGDTFLIV